MTATTIETTTVAPAERHPLDPGTIVYDTWGYDQTNIDFYEVVARTAKFVTLRPIAATTKETGFMCGETVPARDADGKLVPHGWNSKLLRRGYNNSYGWSITSKHGSISIWDGQPKYSSWYA